MAGLTAWQAVFEYGRVAAGQRVLVNGAGGGVGGFVTQLAKYAGAEVIATASPRSTEAVLRQGAIQVIDYTAGPVSDVLDGPVDTLLNLVSLSPSDAAALVPLVRRGGRIISIATPIEPAADAGVSAMHIVARNDVAHLAALVELVDAAALSIDISETRPLADLADVHRLGEAGRTRGKIIVIP
ncbi:zinc-binding dehydrogenase [Streptomyces sp. NPDC087917]|uniref:zinc-binding dehydrogenase n=1 Tax=Streptomyces sp. NPDC087917 TaxID=3155060 RepID=UPI00343F2305